jgi:hypothetical protein
MKIADRIAGIFKAKGYDKTFVGEEDEIVYIPMKFGCFLIHPAGHEEFEKNPEEALRDATRKFLESATEMAEVCK